MNGSVPSAGVILRLAIIISLCTVAASAQEIRTSQKGLPPELVVLDKPPLDEQADFLRAILSEHPAGSRGGLWTGLSQMFSGKPQVVVVAVPDLVENADRLRQTQVEVHGLLRTQDGRFLFAAEAGGLLIDLAGGVKPDGFPQDKTDWVPAAAKGIVELPFDKPVLHALSVRPSRPLARLRLARVLEEQGKYQEALTEYEHAARELQAAGLPWAAFAASQAGWIAYNRLRDLKLARRTLYAAWGPYTVTDRQRRPLFYTWVPLPGGRGWQKMSVAEAVGPLLDNAGRDSFWYRLVDFFVSVAGGQAALGVVLLALATRLVLHPLTRKQLASIEAMSRLQPQIQALQQQYKDDKQKFQQELLRLWQENGVNPFGGCWPMLVQMPILIMVYQGIREYIVRFANSGFLWISNLAMPDLPLLMAYTLSMVFFQQMSSRMQPVTDPQQKQQQQMMNWLMPLMFFFFFRTLPSAFILYWLASNLFYFGEQWLFKKQVAAARARGHVTVPRKRSRFMEALAKAAEQTSAKSRSTPTPKRPEKADRRAKQDRGKN